MMKPKLFSTSLVVVLLASSWLVLHAVAQQPLDAQEANPEAQATEMTTQAVPGMQGTEANTNTVPEGVVPRVPRFPANEGGEIDTLSGSFVVFDPSAGGDPTYVPGTSQTFCFRAESFTDDWEYAFNLWERFPVDVTVNNVYVQGTPTCTSVGSFGTFSWSFLTSPYEVNLYHPRYHAYADHCTAIYCFEVTLGGGSFAPVSWYWDGDGLNYTPHYPCSSDGYTPSGQDVCDEAVEPVAIIPPASPDIGLSPSFQEEDSCACEWQQYTFTAGNFSGADAAFNLTYAVDGPGLIQGPPVTDVIPNGGTQSFIVQAKLDGCMLPGTVMTATVNALEPVSALTSTAVIVRNKAEWLFDPAGWQAEPTTGVVETYWQGCTVGQNPASYGDVGYHVGGSDSVNVTHATLQMYDPSLAAWTQLSPQPHAVFGAVAGWLDGLLYIAGGFDTDVFTSTTDLQVYDPWTDTWDNTTYPDIPATGGRGGVSGGVGTCHTSTGECLFTVGGRLDSYFENTTLETWEYNPSTNGWTQLDSRPQGSSPNGLVFGGGVGCMGYIFQGGEYRGYHDFYRLDATQPSGSQWTEMASIPANAGAMSPAMVCMEDDQAVYLLGGDPNGYWSNYNTSVYRYDILADAWKGPLAGNLDTGVLGSCGLYMDDRLWTFGGSQGTYALAPPPHESLAKVDCPACATFSADKDAPLEADPGQVITYTITLETDRFQPGMILSDTLPAGVEYAGGLTASFGEAWYEPDPVNTVFWSMPEGLEVASPHPPNSIPVPSEIGSVEVDVDLVGDEVEINLPPAPLGPGYAPQDVLWDNGPLVTHPGGGAGGADASALQVALGMSTYGFGHQVSLSNRMADDFTISSPMGWQVDQITFFAYQTNAPVTSTITGVYYQIWDGPPDNPGSSVVVGDLYTNRLLTSTWTNIYRVRDDNLVNTDRSIFADTASVGVILLPGTYWIDWMMDGSLSSGPWAPPITILGQTTTGDALQYTTSSGAWNSAVDSGGTTPQGMPFVIEGSIIQPVEITFNARVTAPAYENIHNAGAVTCGLDSDGFSANTRVIGTPDIAGSVPLPALDVEVRMGASQTVELEVCNQGSATIAWGMGELSITHLLSGLNATTVQLPPPTGLPESLPDIQASSPVQGSGPAAPTNPQAVLWDQPSDNYTAIVDQFFSDFGWGVFSADDFTIDHTWVITNIFVEGRVNVLTTTLTNADSLNWCFFAEVDSKPLGYPIQGGEFSCLTLEPDDPSLTFSASGTAVAVDLNLVPGGPLILPPGKYWMSFYPALNFSIYSQWFWKTSATTNGEIAQVIDPYNLLGRNWRNWSPWTEIFSDLHDAAFRFEGHVLDTPWLSEAPDSGTVDLNMCTSVGVTFDSGDLPLGTNAASLFLQSNDPDEHYFSATATMVVTPREIYLPITRRGGVP